MRPPAITREEGSRTKSSPIEGQRKAQYEEYDSEKKKNAEEIKRLKKEIKELSAAKPSEIDEELIKMSGLPIKELKEFLNKPPEEVERILDLKNMDLRKKLDLIKYEIFKKQEKILDITKQMEDFLMEMDQDAISKYSEPIQKEISRLENKIHLVNVNVLEMRHMQKKYVRIKQSLQEDSVYFESTLKKFEEDIAKQQTEIQRLQEVKDEAFTLRDKTRNALAKLEAEVIAEGIGREQELQDLRRKVEEGRAYLEKVERKLVPSVKTLAREESDDADRLVETEDLAAKEAIEKSLSKLKHVTGAKDEMDVIRKFKTQNETKDRLVKLKETVEKEKRDLEKRKESLESELEALKFAQVKEKEQNEEELEKLKNSIVKKKSEKIRLESEFENDEKQLNDIIEFFYDLCKLMKGFEDTPAPERNEDEEIPELIETVEIKIAALMKYVEDNGILDEMLTDEMLEENLGIEEPFDKKGEGEKEADKTEITDVPTRTFLKRQSQLIVEAKTRKRGFNRDPIPGYK
ncbi:coiled-coil domain-containing protein 151 [Cimex lectularius]|uniref:Uncharacterized protein n=1 Tax=Cimex lectularius TaxID=79782 RepID=A0A8I6SJN0_CIMLE|nr:coiled-coil domain-containing protein 151 [Cimex lectularius]